MALTKTIADCEAYYARGKHVSADEWAAYAVDARAAAFLQSIRELERWKGDELTDPSIDANYSLREDYAAYEQALHVLRRNPARPNASTPNAQYALEGPDGQAGALPAQRICEEARSWMGRPQSQIDRG